LIWDLLTYAKIKPVVNQVELNILNQQSELVRFLLAKDIRPTAYTPVARAGGAEKGDSLVKEGYPDLMKDAYLLSLAEKYNKSVVQIMLNWGLCKGHVVIPKANGLGHQKENINIFDFKLTDEELAQIASMD
jgi:diketogulonate reductase-like aldo/keto reductase